MSLGSLLTGTKILEEVDSKINGKLVVAKDLAWGVHIQAGGITQSGGVATKVWDYTLKRISNFKFQISNCLVLGLGAGGIIKPLKKYFSKAKITGVEIDPVMVNLGKKYFDLENVEVVVQDAETYLSEFSILNSKFDLICVDMYIGQEIPKEFDTQNFAQLTRATLVNNGVVVFNRLYFGEKRKQAEVFHRKLISVFKKVKPIYPEANVMYVCTT